MKNGKKKAGKELMEPLSEWLVQGDSGMVTGDLRDDAVVAYSRRERERKNVEKASTSRLIIGHAKKKDEDGKKEGWGGVLGGMKKLPYNPSQGATAVLQEKKEGERSA